MYDCVNGNIGRLINCSNCETNYILRNAIYEIISDTHIIFRKIFHHRRKKMDICHIHQLFYYSNVNSMIYIFTFIGNVNWNCIHELYNVGIERSKLYTI